MPLSRLVFRARCGIRLYRFLIIALLSALQQCLSIFPCLPLPSENLKTPSLDEVCQSLILSSSPSCSFLCSPPNQRISIYGSQTRGSRYMSLKPEDLDICLSNQRISIYGSQTRGSRYMALKPEDLDIWLYHLSFRFFTMVRRSSPTLIS